MSHQRLRAFWVSFVPRDLWVGFFIGPREVCDCRRFYLCLLPCIVLTWRRRCLGNIDAREHADYVRSVGKHVARRRSEDRE